MICLRFILPRIGGLRKKDNYVAEGLLKEQGFWAPSQIIQPGVPTLRENEQLEYMTLKPSSQFATAEAKGNRGLLLKGLLCSKSYIPWVPPWIAVVISWVYTCVKTCQIVHLTHILYLLPSFTINCQEFQIKPEYIMQREKCDLHWI